MGHGSCGEDMGGRGIMEYEAALSNNNEQEVFEKLPVISLTLGLGVRENGGAR